MNTLFLFLISLVCYGILVAIVIYCLALFYRTKSLNPLLKKREELLSDIHQALNTISALKEEAANQKDEIGKGRQLIDQAEQAKEYLEAFGGTVEDARNTISRIKNDLAEANKDFDEMKSKVDAENEKLTGLRQQLEEASLGLKHTESERQYAEEQLNRITGEIEESKKHLDEVKRAIDSYNVKKSEYESLIQKLADTNAELKKKKEEIADLTLKTEQAERDFAKAKDLAEKSKKEAEDAEKKKDEAEKEYHATKDEIDKLKPLVEGLTEKKKDLDEYIKGKEAQKDTEEANLVGLKTQIEKAKEELSRIKEDTREAKEILAGYDAQIKVKTGGVDTWGELDTPLITAPAFARPQMDSKIKSVDEVKMLDSFAANLESCNIEFNRRTLNAFHTSLKVEDSSPLVVLAGISGTGKSLLPQLYAQQFGFNFLNLAVQPRWDSTQDLFGFYNYAQFKYKATELSRLLWQYDIYNNESCTFKNNPEKLPMNIVLLDEMNLARVEYYFSDMLSKLETRRTVTENNSNRSFAEIEIECGSIGKPRRLFVAGNTLFVGTMNEDETTQALSDKIMDRSNVLRFGRPKKLEFKADPKRFGERFTATTPLTFEQWLSMYNEKPTFELKSLEKTIDDINDCMERAERPYAHRVKTAIVNYVKNYPGIGAVGGEAYKNALSDQIEFKVLPKLNGVEKNSPKVNDALHDILDIISGIDTSLSDTFNEILNDNDAAFFQWHGVRR